MSDPDRGFAVKRYWVGRDHWTDALRAGANDIVHTGWAKFMEWKYPVTVDITDPAAFKAAGIVEAVASL